MGRRLRFFVGILALSAVFFLAWEIWVRNAYVAFLKTVAAPVFGHLDRQNIPVPVSVSNVVPFLVLMLAVPGMGLRRRLRGILLGIAVLLPLHILAVLFTTHWMARPVPSVGGTYVMLLVSAVQMALPFVLWLVLAREPLRGLVFGPCESAKGRNGD